MERVLLDQVIYTDYGQLDFVWSGGIGFDGDVDRFFEGQVNGLVGAAAPDGVYVNLARRSGGSRVRLVLLDTEPSFPAAHYEDVVEVPVMIPDDAEVQWTSWGGETSGLLDVPAGDYRLRVSAHGRDAGSDAQFAEAKVVHAVIDEYLLEMWPAEVQPDEIHRVGSWDGEHWHESWGRRR